MNLTAALFMALAASALPAAAQTVYRCGDSYSQKPCHGSKVIDVDDPRSASQRSQTLEAVQRDSKVAEAMEKARLQEEAKAERSHLAQHKEAAARASEARKKSAEDKSAKPRKPADFTATAPGPKKTKPTRKSSAA